MLAPLPRDCLSHLCDLRSSSRLPQIHWPVTGNRGPTLEPPLSATWAAMEALMDAGLVRLKVHRG